MASGLYGTFPGGDLRASCVSEEVQTRHRNTSARYGFHSAAPERSGSFAQKEPELVSRRPQERSGTKRSGEGRVRATRSSGNVFADLGFPHPEQELLKAKLTLQIYRLIKRRGITQAEAGTILGIKQPHVSALMRNRAGAFSVERLMDFLTALGQDIEIIVRPARKTHGDVSVVA